MELIFTTKRCTSPMKLNGWSLKFRLPVKGMNRVVKLKSLLRCTVQIDENIFMHMEWKLCFYLEVLTCLIFMKDETEEKTAIADPGRSTTFCLTFWRHRPRKYFFLFVIFTTILSLFVYPSWEIEYVRGFPNPWGGYSKHSEVPPFRTT